MLVGGGDLESTYLGGHRESVQGGGGSKFYVRTMYMAPKGLQ